MDSDFKLTTELKQILTTDQAWHYHIVPNKVEEGGKTSFFYSDEVIEKESFANELLVLLGLEVVLVPQQAKWINHQLNKYYPRDRFSESSISEEIDNSGDKDLLPKMIEEAFRIGSSDIHVETYEERCRVRFRIDGKLVERYVISKHKYPALINKIKIKANLDISEKRLPQDGRIIFAENGRKIDIRVSILPTMFGEKTVLRLLNREASQIDLLKLGFNDDQFKDYIEGIRKPNGIVLISGPTGSGKTTTLYATLKRLNKEDTNILTIEDPIEYTLQGINQVQLREAIGLNFSSAIRTFLRQDPDVIMLGEIRDKETAQMAVRAALTGHLVLSTVHTNSAWGTISRLVDMGIPAYLVASTLNLSVAQRLVRKLCPECKKKVLFNSELYPPTFIPSAKVEEHWLPVGCDHCYYTGYKGRLALYEIIPIDSFLKMHIQRESFNIKEYLKEKTILNLSDVAFNMFKNGITSIDEIYAILGS